MCFEFAVELEWSGVCECMCATSINEELCKECMKQPSRRVMNECKREVVLMDEESSEVEERVVLIQQSSRSQPKAERRNHASASYLILRFILTRWISKGQVQIKTPKFCCVCVNQT